MFFKECLELLLKNCSILNDLESAILLKNYEFYYIRLLKCKSFVFRHIKEFIGNKQMKAR